MEKINLNGSYLLGLLDDQFYPVDREFGKISDLRPFSHAAVIDAQVPSNFELDMQRADLLPDLFMGENLLKAQELEMLHLFYSREFTLKNPKAYVNPYLVFEGIDTFADIYLNGVKIGSTDNMLMTHTIKAEGLKAGKNELFVHIIPVAIKAREYDYPMGSFALKYNFDNTQVRKSNFMAGWDIFPRIMSGGIWKDVTLVDVSKIRFLQNYLFTNYLSTDLTQADLCFYYELSLEREKYADYHISVEGVCGDSTFSVTDRIWSKAGRLNCTVRDPKLWWPKGSGEQNLYSVTVRLFKNEVLMEEKSFHTGIRKVELERTSVTDEEGNGEFCFKVNYRKIFILGTNWVPLDSFPSRGKAKIPAALELVDDIGCNMIRVWGGGYYEDDLFYDLCDEKGFLVWQDFMMGCAMYPQDRNFMERLEVEFTQVVQRLRQHPCLALWAGDNECDCACEWAGNHADPNDNIITRELLPKILRDNDYVRAYLPSSPYRDEIAFQKGVQYVTEDHLWGPRDYFKGEFYTNALAHFASETGYHGCPSVESVKKFITEDGLWPYANNPQWRLHASSPATDDGEPYVFRIELMANQIQVLFGHIPDSLEEFSRLSQVSQAEAMKFFVERFRMGKWHRTGLIWWNILDGCPQFSDAVVDYYFNKKLAYYYIKQSQQPVCMMFEEPRDGVLRLFAVNDTMEDRKMTYTVTDLQTDKVIGQGDAFAEANSSQAVANFSEADGQTIWNITWELDGKVCRNHYVCGKAPFNQKQYLHLARKAGFEIH